MSNIGKSVAQVCGDSNPRQFQFVGTHKLPPRNEAETGSQSISVNPVPSQRPPASRHLNDLFGKFDLQLQQAEKVDQLGRGLSQVIAEQAKSLAIWIAKRETTGDFSQVRSLLDPLDHGLWSMVQDQITSQLPTNTKKSVVWGAHLGWQTDRQLVVVPIDGTSAQTNESTGSWWLIGCFEESPETLDRLTWLMGEAGVTFRRWLERQETKRIQHEGNSLKEVLGTIQELNRAANLPAAIRSLACRLRKQLAVDQVAITLNGKLVAVSDVEQFDRSNEVNQAMEIAAEQGCQVGHAVLFCRSQGVQQAEQLPLERFCKLRDEQACASIPFFPAASETGETLAQLGFQGGVLLIAKEERFQGNHSLAPLEQQIFRLGEQLTTVHRAHQGRWDRLQGDVFALWQHRWRNLMLTFSILTILGLSMPLPYRVPCETELRPVLRRFVTAPFDSVLEKSWVKNGDLVTKNQLLATLDGRNLRIELAGLEAEFSGAKKRQDSALATGNIAQSQIAKSEMERHKKKMELIQRRLIDLEIRSPIDGIVVSGDLDRAEGASLTTGQNLFEVAPLDEMIAELAVPESEIQYVRPGLEVAVKMNAFPFKTWNGTVQNIHSQAETIDSQTVFVAQVMLTNKNEILRPGMKGKGKISSQWAPLGWNLFHRSWENVRYWLVW